MAATFCTSSKLKRSDGRIEICSCTNDFENTEFIDSCLELAIDVTGNLYFHTKCTSCTSDVARWNIKKVRASLSTNAHLTYALHHNILNVTEHSPEKVFENHYSTCHKYIYYRPALLNGRHVVDVLRTICGQINSRHILNALDILF